MKFIVLFLLLLSFSLSKAQTDSTLFGYWELIKLEINNTTLTPNSEKYKVKITEKEFTFNVDVNWCFLSDWKTAQNKIVTTGHLRMCTKMCCDDPNSIFYENLNYTGKWCFLS